MNAMLTRKFAFACALGMLPLLAACNRDADVDDEDVPPATEVTTDQAIRVTDVDIGRSIGTDNLVNDNDDTDEFRPTDTVYASVVTEGTASGSTLSALWTFEDGQVVEEMSQAVTPSSTGRTITEFHIAKPDGFPVGKYKVEIKLNGNSVETEEFTVK